MEIWTEVDGVPAVLQPNLPPDGHHVAAVLDFVAAVLAGEVEGHQGEEALVRAAVVDACYASAERGTEVRL